MKITISPNNKSLNAAPALIVADTVEPVTVDGIPADFTGDLILQLSRCGAVLSENTLIRQPDGTASGTLNTQTAQIIAVFLAGHPQPETIPVLVTVGRADRIAGRATVALAKNPLSQNTAGIVNPDKVIAGHNADLTAHPAILAAIAAIESAPGAQGEKGEKGDKGDPGEVPTAWHTELTKLATRVTALEGKSVDLTNLEVTNATWKLKGNSRVIFSPESNDYCAGLWFDDAAMFQVQRDWQGGKNAYVAQGLCFLDFAAYVDQANIALNAGYLCFGAGARHVQFGNGATEACFGAWAGCVFIGTEYGTNTYFGLCVSGGGGGSESTDLACLDLTDVRWTLRGNSIINFVANGGDAGIEANGLCMLKFDSSPSYTNVWVAHNVSGVVEVGASAGWLCVGFGACHVEVGTGSAYNSFGSNAQQNYFGNEYTPANNHYYGA